MVERLPFKEKVWRFESSWAHRVKLGFARVDEGQVGLGSFIIYCKIKRKSDFLLMKYYVYVLFSLKDRLLYVGSTKDLVQRLVRHKVGKVRATKLRRPIQLIHYEYFIDKNEALAREKFLKSGFGRNELKKALKHTLKKLGYKKL